MKKFITLGFCLMLGGTLAYADNIKLDKETADKVGEALLTVKENDDIKNDPVSKIIKATEECDIAALKTLVKSKGDANPLDKNGKKVNLLKIGFESPCGSFDFGQKGGPKYDVIKFLLSKGADQDLQDENGDTILHLSAQSSVTDYDMYFLLMAYGVNYAIKNNDGLIAEEIVRKNFGSSSKKFELLSKIRCYLGPVQAINLDKETCSYTRSSMREKALKEFNYYHSIYDRHGKSKLRYAEKGERKLVGFDY